MSKGGAMGSMVKRPSPAMQGSVYGQGQQQPFVVQGSPMQPTPPTQNPFSQPQSQWPGMWGQQQPQTGNPRVDGNPLHKTQGGPAQFPSWDPTKRGTSLGGGMTNIASMFPWMNQRPPAGTDPNQPIGWPTLRPNIGAGMPRGLFG